MDSNPQGSLPDEYLTIVLPEYSEDMISDNLRSLTEALARQGVEISGGLLGGEYGYGAYFENTVFMMHPYCWCEQDQCLWCLPCLCPDETLQYFVDEKKVSFEEFLEAGGYSNPASKIAVLESLQCEKCRNGQQPAPNFLHKSTDTRIWWYKYIGRGMEVSANGDWETIYQECLDSIS